MSVVKAHITFDEKIAGSKSKQKMLNEIKKETNLSDINEERFDLYGVLTGNLDESDLETVRQIPGVANVQIDQKRHLQE